MSHPTKNCTVCLSHNRSVPATRVARSRSGLEWYECDGHRPADNLTGESRVSSTPLAEWLEKAGLFASVGPG
jgi:hypothetical protein